MDAVYVLGSGSTHRDYELYCSLVSLRKFVSEIDKVFVIGDYPRFKRGSSPAFTHVPAHDLFRHKSNNVRWKLERICGLDELSNDFFFLNDDFFFLENASAGAWPFYSRGSLREHIVQRQISFPSSVYVRLLQNTEDWLRAAGLPMVDYCVHCPIRYDREGLRALFSKVEVIPFGHSIRTLYANYNSLVRPVATEDCKVIQAFDSEKAILETLDGFSSFSIGEGSFTPAMGLVLESFYGKPA